MHLELEFGSSLNSWKGQTYFKEGGAIIVIHFRQMDERFISYGSRRERIALKQSQTKAESTLRRN